MILFVFIKDIFNTEISLSFNKREVMPLYGNLLFSDSFCQSVAGFKHLSMRVWDTPTTKLSVEA